MHSRWLRPNRSHAQSQVRAETHVAVSTKTSRARAAYKAYAWAAHQGCRRQERGFKFDVKLQSDSVCLPPVLDSALDRRCTLMLQIAGSAREVLPRDRLLENCSKEGEWKGERLPLAERFRRLEHASLVHAVVEDPKLPRCWCRDGSIAPAAFSVRNFGRKNSHLFEPGPFAHTVMEFPSNFTRLPCLQDDGAPKFCQLAPYTV